MSDQFKLGDRLADKYRLERPLGEGAYGTVWKAIQENVGRPVAIKLLKHARLDASSDRRFEREAKALARLDHPNCVVLFDYGHHGDQAFLVTEYLAGETLHDWLREERALTEVLDVAYQLLDALAHAHQIDVVHRDLKPGNIMLQRDPDGRQRVKVLDFGISSIAGEQRGDITKTGELFGTPGYMSPEQLNGEETIGPASDLYATGVILFTMLDGHPPFRGKNQIEAVLKHLTEEAPPLERDVPDGLRRVVARLLEKEADARFPSARAVQAALRELALEVSGSTPVIAAAAPPILPSPAPLPPATPPSAALVTTPEAAPSDRNRAFIWIALAVSVVLILIGGLVLYDPGEPAPVGDLNARIATALSTPPSTRQPAAPTRDVGLTGPLDVGADPDAHDTGAAGCGDPFTGRGLQTIRQMSGVEELATTVFVPASYDPTVPHPVVVLFHDTAQSPRRLLEQTGFDRIAEQDGFILVLPHDDVMLNAWQSSGSHARAAREFDLAVETLCVDLDRVYLYGHGGGGLAAEELSCVLDRVEAVAVSAHRLGQGQRPCKHASTRYMLLTPLRDERDPPEGGIGCLGGAKISLAAHEQVYQRLHGCDDASRVVSRHRHGTCFSWECTTPFVSCHVDGGRPLPGGEPNVPCEGTAVDFPYGERVWTFFTQPPPPQSHESDSGTQ